MDDDGTSFTLLHDVAVPSDPVLVQWCPTMDVCAVASQDGQLRLHRMNWQLLWSIVPEADVSALCWHPSGKVLAAGLQNGVFVLLDVETGHVQTRHKAHFAAVARICWSECFQPGTTQSATSHTTSAAAASYTRFFQPPDPAAAHSATTAAIPGPYPPPAAAHHSNAAWPLEPATLDLLVVADARGTLTLWAQGQLQVAEVSLAALFPHVTTTSIQGVMLTAALDQLLVVHGTAQGGLQLSSCCLQLLRRHRTMLQHCSARLGLVAQLVADALAGLTSLAKDWAGHTGEARQRLQQQLVTDLEAQGSPLTDASGEFLLLLAAGCVSPVMHQYLSSSLGEAGLRRLARGIDTAAGRLHAFLLDQLLPRLRLATYVLAELRGVAATPSAALPELDLPAALFRQLELLAVVLQLRAEQLRLGVVRVAGQYRAFFGWLLGVLRAVEASSSDGGGAGGKAAGEVGSLERLQDVTAFLRGQFLRDLVGGQLQKEELVGDALSDAHAFLLPGSPPGAADQLLAAVCPWVLAAPLDQEDLLAGPLLLPKGAAAAAAAAPGPATATGGWGGGPALAAGEEVPSGPPSWRLSTPLMGLLQELSSRCGDALEQPCGAISPAITAAGSWVLEAGQGGSSSSSSSSSGAGRVSIGVPISQPVQKQDSTCSICCRRQQGGGAAEELLLVRSCCSRAAEVGSGGGLVWECCSVQVPEEVVLVDAAWYQGGQLALLVQGPQGAAGGNSSRPCVLQLVDVSEAPWRQQQQQQAAALGGSAAGGDWLSSCAAVGLQQLPCRSRALPGSRCGQAPLGVSRTRGLALVVSDMQHVGVWDLEEDEEGEEEEEGEAAEADEMEA